MQLASSFLAAVAIAYALLAGLHTLQDVDLGWQLSTGRWVVQHHRVFSTEVFSYTASGQPWVYPVLSGVLFYLTFLMGSYALLSWMGAIACAGTVATLASRRNVFRSALALVAVPMIANRAQPRAEMFTTLLFAMFLVLLWRQHRSGRSPLWLLPLLMILWVNLHPGFVAGMALCAAYVLLEVLDFPFAAKREGAISRLRAAWPWLALTPVATLINPWPISIYSALVRQQRAQALHNLWLVEWENVRLSLASLHQAADWRDPQSSFWWLLAVSFVCVIVSVWRKEWGTAVLLAGSAYLAIQHVRLQALFACVAVVVGGSVISQLSDGKIFPVHVRPSGDRPQFKLATVTVLMLAVISLAGLRSYDLFSNRYYLRSAQRSLFGAGLSWWFPERAVDFLRREHLPANIFNGYSLGGYLTWRLFPDYRDYIDSRALPFGPELFFRAYDLVVEPPDSPAWRQEANAREINTIIIPLSRYQGMTLFPQLPAFCQSKLWRAVYMDEVSAIFVRVTPETAPVTDQLQIDCSRVSFTPPHGAHEAQTFRGEAELFNFWANAGGVLYSLGRYPEALASLDRAQSIFQDNANLHLLRALVFQQVGQAAQAEQEFRTSLSLEPTDEGWFDLGLFYMTQRRYAEAAGIFAKSAESSSRPHEMWMMLGQAYVQMRQPQPALDAFEKAVDSSPFREGGQSLGASFNSLVAAGRANAWYQLGDLSQAVSFQEEAVKLAPEDRQLWLGLADLYQVQGRITKAAEARSHANPNGSQ